MRNVIRVTEAQRLRRKTDEARNVTAQKHSWKPKPGSQKRKKKKKYGFYRHSLFHLFTRKTSHETNSTFSCL